MAADDFLPFGGGGAANVIDQPTYAALAARLTGFQAGTAQSAQLNKVWRQSSIMASVVAQFIVNQTGQPAIDDGTTATLLSNLATAVAVSARQNPVLTDTGAANAYVVANLSAFTAYPTVSGLVIDVSIANANTGASTLNVDGLGTKPILGLGLQPLQGGELIVKGVACLMYVVASTVNGGNGAWVIMGSTGAALQIAPATRSQHAMQPGQQGHGQCRLSVASATSLVLNPYNGNVVVVNGVPLQLPSPGVSISNASLAASTVYYVYLAGTTASPSLVLSTTTHVTGSNGIKVMSGDATKTLVGRVWTNASSQFVTTAAGNRMLCRSWFNRSSTFDNITTAPFNITNTSIAEISSAMRINFLCWADEAVQVFIGGLIQNNTAGSNITVAGYIDGFSVTPTQSFTSPVANQGAPYNVGSVQQYSEAVLHLCTLYGQVNGNTGTLTQNVNLVIR